MILIPVFFEKAREKAINHTKVILMPSLATTGLSPKTRPMMVAHFRRGLAVRLALAVASQLEVVHAMMPVRPLAWEVGPQVLTSCLS